MDGALSGAGTPEQKLAKPIAFPPSMVALGRNPIEASAEAIHSGLLKGQYYSALENAPPTVGISARFEDRIRKKTNFITTLVNFMYV